MINLCQFDFMLLMLKIKIIIHRNFQVLQDCNNYELLGYDLVSNCTNENLSHGAEPLFFLDTYSTGKLDTSVAAKVIQGIVKGCKEANCALIGKIDFFPLCNFPFYLDFELLFLFLLFILHIFYKCCLLSKNIYFFINIFCNLMSLCHIVLLFRSTKVIIQLLTG